jgi:hypothetical protein
MREKSSAALSVKMSETVRGYEVKRLPLGEYLRAMEALRDMPQTVMRGSSDILLLTGCV